jgi:hypothetical protein
VKPFDGGERAGEVEVVFCGGEEIVGPADMQMLPIQNHTVQPGQDPVLTSTDLS